jgi:HAD superfamily hydrolase (TIGR01509 family)
VNAWWRAARAVGHPVDAWRIHEAIGMDSTLLLERLFGDPESDDAKRASQYNTAYFAEHFHELRLLPGARELLAATAERGHRVVLATSAPDTELDVLLRVIDSDDVITAVTHSGDVDQAKPSPDVIRIALDRAGVDAERAVMVGDAVWDVRAASAAGLACIGVRSGGAQVEALRDAGATAIYDDAQDLVDRLDDSPIGTLGH